jgi:hypothetical protein
MYAAGFWNMDRRSTRRAHSCDSITKVTRRTRKKKGAGKKLDFIFLRPAPCYKTNLKDMSRLTEHNGTRLSALAACCK